MNALHAPWLELAIVCALIGWLIVARIREPNRAFRWGLAVTGCSFVCTLLAWLAFYLGVSADELARYSLQPRLFGRMLFRFDELNASLLPAVALLHLLTALATARRHMRRFSIS